ncbi:hypothetical protein pb186bvf_008197 [Paramecium bursaria]
MKQTQTRIQSAVTNSRQRDNHYDPNIHQKAWIAPGIFNMLPKYEHLDSGLVVLPKKSVKYKNYKELSEVNEQIQQKQMNSDIRNFKEFDTLMNGDLVVTIEYCTNCSTHQGSTRHDEEKYYSYATTLKQEIIAQYPMAKVYLKPLIYDPKDQSVDTLYIQRRIGAFEVQVCSKYQDEVKKGLLFSKLRNKMWPNYQEVVSSIVGYLNTSPLQIFVTFGEGVQGNLNNIEVLLQPQRQHDRPLSSVSKTSRQSNRTKVERVDRKIAVKTNQQGLIKLDAVPIDLYVVEVMESNDYQYEQFILNMVEMYESNQEMQVIITLRKQNHSFLDIKVWLEQQAVAEAKVIITQTQSLENMLAKELAPGNYEAILEPGEYVLSIQKKGILDYKQSITATQGINYLNINVEKDANEQLKPPSSAKQLQPVRNNSASARPQSGQKSNQSINQSDMKSASKPPQLPIVPIKQQQQQQQIQAVHQVQEPMKQEDGGSGQVRPISGYKSTIVFIYDPYTNQPVSGVTIQMNEDSTKKTTTYTTDEEGTCKIILQNVLEGKMVIKHEGFFPIVEEYGTNQQKMNLYLLRELSFPLIQMPTDDKSVQFMVQTNVETMPIDIKVILPDNVQIDDSFQNVVYDFNDESGCLRITINDLNSRKGVFRVIADIIQPEYLHPQTLKLYVITNKDIKFVDVPKNLEDQTFWDIGVICAPNISFLEINTPTSEHLERDKYLKDYQKLLQFLKNSKNLDLKTILGFNDKEKLELQGDILVQKEKIKQSLDKYNFEHIVNLDYLIQSAQMSNGLYSFKKLEQKFNNLDFEFVFDQESSYNKQEESEDEPYDEDYDI